MTRHPPEENSREGNLLTRFFKLLGPGVITGAADDDPTAIATYIQAGALFGFSTLWTAWVTFPMMAAAQYISAKVGLVTGEGLARVLRQQYSPWLFYPAILGLLIANTINAGADLGAIAAAVNLLIPIPVGVTVVLIAVLILALQIWGSYQLIERVFKWLTLTLFAYIGAAFLARPDAAAVLRGTLIPTVSFDATFLATLVAILGTNISPYLFFWQASLEVEEEKRKGYTPEELRTEQGATELRQTAWDTLIGMGFSNLVVFFINLAAAAALFSAGPSQVSSVADAAQALRPLAGDAATILFAIGMIGSGLLAVPVLTGASAYAMAEVFGWREGLNEPWSRATPFYAVIVISTLVGLLFNFLGINPINALVWSAAINGVLAPPLLVMILRVANDPAVMGQWSNGPISNLAGWITTGAMFAAAIGLFLTWGAI